MGDSDTERIRTPWHIWVVGILTLLWNAMGAFDYTMTKTQNAQYMSQFSDAQLDYFYSFPAWVVAAWAIAVWFSVIGSALILLRHRWAVPVFWTSFVAMAITSLHNFVLDDVSLIDITGPFAIVFAAIIFVIAALLVWYSTVQRDRGVLT